MITTYSQMPWYVCMRMDMLFQSLPKNNRQRVLCFPPAPQATGRVAKIEVVGRMRDGRWCRAGGASTALVGGKLGMKEEGWVLGGKTEVGRLGVNKSGKTRSG